MFATAGEQKQINDLDRRVTTIETKMDAFMAEMRERDIQRTIEMRDRDNQRAAELRELRLKQEADANAIRAQMAAQQAKYDEEMKKINDRMDAQQAKHDQNMEQLRQDVKDISKDVRNLFFAFLAIIITIMVGVFWNNHSIEKKLETAAAARAANATKVEQPIETAER